MSRSKLFSTGASHPIIPYNPEVAVTQLLDNGTSYYTLACRFPAVLNQSVEYLVEWIRDNDIIAEEVITNTDELVITNIYLDQKFLWNLKFGTEVSEEIYNFYKDLYKFIILQ